MQKIFEDILNETITPNIKKNYKKDFLNGNVKEKFKPNYTDETKEMFARFKRIDNTKEKMTVKPQKDKAVGKASQRRGKGRGCI